MAVVSTAEVELVVDLEVDLVVNVGEEDSEVDLAVNVGEEDSEIGAAEVALEAEVALTEETSAETADFKKKIFNIALHFFSSDLEFLVIVFFIF